jgi:hypothetical protein
MEKRILDIENEFNLLENKNISLYMKNVKDIKKNMCKLEINLNKLCKDCDSDDESNDEEIDNIDKYLESYCLLLNSINDENINNKTLEELIELSKQLESMEKNIKTYQKSNNELNIINL